MSSALDLFIAICFATACSLLVRTLIAAGKLPKWRLGIAVVPVLCWGVALAILLLPRLIPDGWQEGDFGTGFADFVALVFFGVALPSAYLAVALPVALLVRLWKNRRMKGGVRWSSE